MPEPERCPECQGTGTRPGMEGPVGCGACKGTGKVPERTCGTCKYLGPASLAQCELGIRDVTQWWEEACDEWVPRQEGEDHD